MAYSVAVLKLLLITQGCDGTDVGESWVAYQWARRLAERHEVTVLTYHKRSRDPAGPQLPGARVIEWTEPRGLGRAERLNSLLKPGYLPYYLRARRWIQRALAQGERFDLAHQPVPVAMRYPSPVAGLGIPFVIGPVGGSLESPPGFAEEDTAPWYVGLRRLDHWRVRHDPLLRRTYERADCVLGIAPYVGDFLSPVAVRRFEILFESGIDRMPDAIDRTGRYGEVRLLFVGRLIRTKGARDAIRALSLVRDLPVVLDIVGAGFDRAACEALAVQLNVADRVRFAGQVARGQVENFYADADIFLFPSYREPGGNAPFEAMSHGLPMIVSDLGGPGAVVDDTCGMRIHPVSPEQYAIDIAAAVRALVRDPARRLALGQGARQRASAIGLWENKIGQMEAIYASILAGAPEPIQQ